MDEKRGPQDPTSMLEAVIIYGSALAFVAILLVWMFYSATS